MSCTCPDCNWTAVLGEMRITPEKWLPKFGVKELMLLIYTFSAEKMLTIHIYYL